MNTIHPIKARICRNCENLVTDDSECPLCGEDTEPHPDRTASDGYCVKCAEGPFPADQLHVVTWNEDPYLQMEDGDMTTICLKCHSEDTED